MTFETFLAELNEPGREQAKCLSQIASEVNPQLILEIGSGWGVSAVGFLNGSKANLITIDPIPNLPDFDRRIKEMGFGKRITRMLGRSGSPPPKYENQPHHLVNGLKEVFDLIFVDGSHEYAYVKEDLLNCLKKIKPKGTIVLDDYYHEHNWTGKYGVAKAVCEVIKEKKLQCRIYPAAHGIARIDL
jgi:predicted O-methyltransferase YrrM